MSEPQRRSAVLAMADLVLDEEHEVVDELVGQFVRCEDFVGDHVGRFAGVGERALTHELVGRVERDQHRRR
jgi:hypothetical protein